MSESKNTVETKEVEVSDDMKVMIDFITSILVNYCFIHPCNFTFIFDQFDKSAKYTEFWHRLIDSVEHDCHLLPDEELERARLFPLYPAVPSDEAVQERWTLKTKIALRVTAVLRKQLPILDWFIDKENKAEWQDVPVFSHGKIKSVEVSAPNEFTQACLRKLEIKATIANKDGITWGNLIEALVRTNFARVCTLEYMCAFSVNLKGDKLEIDVEWEKSRM